MDDDQVTGCCSYQGRKKRSSLTMKPQNKLLSKYKSENFDISDDDILEVMVKVYVSDDDDWKKLIRILCRCRLNPNFGVQNKRNDLEYFIPQIINYLVFHKILKQDRLIEFVIKASKLDFYFAHQVYFQLKSMSVSIQDKKRFKYKSVINFINEFIMEMSQNYQNQILVASQLLIAAIDYNTASQDVRQSMDMHNLLVNNKQKIYQGTVKPDRKNNSQLQIYGTDDQSCEYIVQQDQIQLVDYESIFQEQVSDDDRSFLSNIDFWEDLIKICDELSNHKNKKQELIRLLQLVNSKLPAAVYIPFVTQSLRNYVVLNIVAEESRVFSTKTRSPFSLFLEIYRPEEELKGSNFDLQISAPLMAKMTKDDDLSKSDNIEIQHSKQNRKSLSYQGDQFNKQMQNDISQIRLHHLGQSQDSYTDQPDQMPAGVANFYKIRDLPAESDSLEEQSSTKSEFFGSRVSYLKQEKGVHLTIEQKEDVVKVIFGEDFSAKQKKIKLRSPYRMLKSWKLAPLIIKTGDNLKQEQFALQLICQFDQIFKAEGLPLKLTYYEVLSIGPDSGIMQMVQNATTLDSLCKEIYQKFPQFENFSDFFRSFYRDNIDQALRNYLNSLVAYSLVCYFLQVKDRHNGNILLHKDGSLIHIDFGFFLSNAPGKGLEFEKTVPFKLFSEHIQVLGGAQGQLFEEFRKLFHLGFKAAQKHQREILLLVHMMYSGQGTTLPCFSKGDQSIRDLEARFNPRVQSDAELNVHTQELINASLDNWRAKWYDKFQYFFQGIFY